VGRFTYSYGSPVPAGSRALPSQLAANLVKVSLPTHYDADQPVHAWTERGVSSSSIARLYHYENASYPTLLTGISVLGQGSDGKLMNQRLVTWGYDSQGRANLSVKGEPARYETGKDGKELTPRKLVAGTGIEQVTLAWPKPGVTVLTNSLGQQTTYKTATIADENRILEVRGAGCASCGPSNIRYDYDSLGRLIEETQLSADGIPQKTTRTERDGLGRPIKISTVAYANGKPQAAQLVVRYAYGNIDTDAPNLIVRPSVVPGKEYQIRIAYNDHGQPVRVTESGFSPALDGSAVLIERTTSYKYQSVNGRSVLAEIDGPLQNGPSNSPADSDITRYTWDSRGNAVQGIAYPMGLVARFEYDQKGINPTGRLIKTTGVDGIATELKYSPNGTVEQVNRAGAITRYSQDALGRTVQVLDPVGQRLQFSYDNAGEITSIFDQQNNRIQLLRDTEGELMQARLLNPDGSLSQQGVDYRQSLPDAQGRQSPLLEPAGPSRDAVLAAVRQLIASARMADSTNIARPDLAASPYAALQEFMAAADRPDAKERSAISTARDSQGRLTTYLHDDFNRLILAQSPTTGSTSYRYNLADQIVARISQDGSRAEYVRDVAGRVVAVKAYNAQNRLDEDATITWGKANKPERIKYMAGEEQFAYDEAGRLIAHIQIIDGKRFTLRYRYNSAGQLLAKTLPEGQTLSYRYRGTVHPRAGLLESVWLNGFDNATGNALTSGLLDRPIVQGMNDENERYTRRGFTFGNGLTSQLTLDAYGRILSAGNAQVGQTQLAYGGGQAAQPASLQDDEALTVQTRRAQLLGQPAEREAAQALMSRLWGAMTSWRASPADALLETTPGILDMGQAEVRFDERGRQTAQGRARFVYDSLNRLTEVRQATGGMDPSGKAIEQPVAQYRYNLFGGVASRGGGLRVCRASAGAGAGENRVQPAGIEPVLRCRNRVALQHAPLLRPGRGALPHA
jgi:YD repeat-containing protein